MNIACVYTFKTMLAKARACEIFWKMNVALKSKMLSYKRPDNIKVAR